MGGSPVSYDGRSAIIWERREPYTRPTVSTLKKLSVVPPPHHPRKTKYAETQNDDKTDLAQSFGQCVLLKAKPKLNMELTGEIGGSVRARRG